jgi:ribosomal protein S12 methylthiotransferase accessory factor
MTTRNFSSTATDTAELLLSTWQNRQILRQNLARVREQADVLTDAVGGLINNTFPTRRWTGDPALFVYGTSVNFPQEIYPAVTRLPEDGITAGGSGLFKEEAELKAICEAIERYCNYACPTERLIYDTALNLGKEALDLDKLPRLSATELERLGVERQLQTKSVPRYWVRGISLHSRQPTWIPASLVYLGLGNEYAAAEATVTPFISTGTALGSSLEHALVSGLCEVIERDAFTISWLNRLPLPRLELPSLDKLPFELAERLRRVQAWGIETYFFDATLDLGIPTVIALQVTPDGRIACVTASATGFEPLRLMAKCLDECSAVRMSLTVVTKLRPKRREDFSRGASLEDSMLFYADAEAISYFDYLTRNNTTPPRQLSDFGFPNNTEDAYSDKLNLLLSRFHQAGLEAFAVDITVPEVRPTGFWAVKTIVPGMHPLGVQLSMRFLDNPRLYRVPSLLGYKQRSEADVPNLPTPFD